jgi:hypothetical protein
MGIVLVAFFAMRAVVRREYDGGEDSDHHWEKPCPPHDITSHQSSPFEAEQPFQRNFFLDKSL